MTTTVTVKAHLSTAKEVVAGVYEKDELIESAKLQDGETQDFIVYDDRVVTVMEVDK